MSDYLGSPNRGGTPTMKSPRSSKLNSKLRPSVGSSKYNALMEERQEQLVKQFIEIDKNQDGTLSFQEIYNFLSEKQGAPFNMDLCQELFKKLDKNQDSVVTSDEFISAYVEAEDQMRTQLKDIDEHLSKSNKELDRAKKKLIGARANEKTNINGIMHGSFVTVQVVSAQDLRPVDLNGLSDPYVTVECHSQNIHTQVREKDLNPVWNEEFTFYVDHGEGSINIQIMSLIKGKPDEAIGKVEIPLEAIKDQQKHEKSYQLQGQGKVILGLQWIWSTIKYLDSIVQKWEHTIHRESNTRQLLDEQLKYLRKPFGPLLVGTPYLISRESSVLSLSQNYDVHVRMDPTNRITVYKSIPLTWTAIVYLFIIMATFVMFLRSDYVNVSLSLAMFSEVTRKEYRAKYLLIAIGVSEVYDVAWFYLNFGGWYSESWDEPEHAMKTMILLASICNFITKLSLLSWFLRRLSD